MAREPLTIFGVPVVESEDVPDDTLIVVGSGVLRQTFELVLEGGRYVLKAVGPPYDPAAREST